MKGTANVPTDVLHGNSMLYDPARGVILRGEIRLVTDGKGRSEIHVKNSETGITDHLVFQSGSLWIPVMQLIQMIQDTHIEVDVGVRILEGSACNECNGVGEVTDAEGNWMTCSLCGGRV